MQTNAFPLVEHPLVAPAVNETYLEFGRLRALMGLGPYSHNDIQYNLIRASCEYLTAQKTTLPELASVAEFLGQGWQIVLAQLKSYPPVVPLLTPAQHSFAFRPDAPGPQGHMELAVQDAQDYVQGCLDFLSQQEQRPAVHRFLPFVPRK